WKTDPQCRDTPTEPGPSPCDSNAQRLQQAEHLCQKLKSDIFKSCHGVEDVQPYYHNCLYDICACEANLQDCLCPSLGQYADTCASLGVKVNWRLNVSQCALTCPEGERYQVCGNPCERTCSNMAAARDTCSSRCVEGCNCPDGQALDDNGECVAVSQCPCVFDGRQFPPRFTALMGADLCTCTDAQWECSRLPYDDEESEVPTLVQPLCPPTMHYTDCPTSCPVTCDNMDSPPTCSTDTAHCQPGCTCNPGLVLENGVCVNASMCPCHHGGQAFHEGDVIMKDCNKCTCKSRRWQCDAQECPGMCSAVGDSHYTTFDGRDYQFQGSCDYVLARSRDGSPQPFLVTIENVACGSSGVTCTKMVELSVGEPVSTVGSFVHVDTPFGLSLQWDQGTRLYIKLSTQHRGQVQGLCGNFNGDQKDDFTTPQGGPPAVRATAFGDSWKMHAYCADSQEVVDTCARAPHRKPWAQKKCGVLASDLFRPCHAVEPYTKYLDKCVYDACACDQGGDCHCLCTAIAAYAHVCATKGVPIKWRRNGLCAMECEDCETYNPCITTCPKKTCHNRLVYDQLLTQCQGASSTCSEGCDLHPCPAGQVYDSLTPPVSCIPEPLCETPACEVNGKMYREGERVEDETVCNQKLVTSSPASSSPKTSSSSTTPSSFTSTRSATTVNTGSPLPPRCKQGWTAWMSAYTPTLANVGDVETVSALRMRYSFCQEADMESIECRVVGETTHAQRSGQNVTCRLPEGLVCRHRDQTQGMCYDYELRFFCKCEPVPSSGVSVSSTPGAHDTETPTPTPSPSPSPGAQSRQTITYSPTTAKQGVVTSVPGTRMPYSCTQGWTAWFNLDSPSTSRDDEWKGPGDYETVTGMRNAYSFCAKPTAIRCREVYSQRPAHLSSSPASCDLEEGLVCLNSQAPDKLCEDFEVSFHCDCGKETLTTLIPDVTPTPGLSPTDGHVFTILTSNVTGTASGSSHSPTGTPTARPPPSPVVGHHTVSTQRTTVTGETGTPSLTPTRGPHASPTAGEHVTGRTQGVTGPGVGSTQAPSATPTSGPSPSPTAGNVTGTESYRTPEVTPTPSPSAPLSTGAGVHRHTDGVPGSGVGSTQSPSATPTPGPSASPTTSGTTGSTLSPSATPTSGPGPTPGVTVDGRISNVTGSATVSGPTSSPSASPTAVPRMTPTAGEEVTGSTGSVGKVSTENPEATPSAGPSPSPGTGSTSSVTREGETTITGPEGTPTAGPNLHPSTPSLVSQPTGGVTYWGTGSTLPPDAVPTAFPHISPPPPGEPWDYLPSCMWTSWMNSDSRKPTSVGDFETFSNLRMSYPFCEHPVDIECRVASDAVPTELAGVPYNQAHQMGITCDLNRGLTCLDTSQVKGDKCLDYEVRVYCVDACPSTTSPAPGADVTTTKKPEFEGSTTEPKKAPTPGGDTSSHFPHFTAFDSGDRSTKSTPAEGPHVTPSVGPDGKPRLTTPTDSTATTVGQERTGSTPQTTESGSPPKITPTVGPDGRPELTTLREGTATSTPGQERTGQTTESGSPPKVTPTVGPDGRPSLTTREEGSLTSTPAHEGTGSTAKTTESGSPPDMTPSIGPEGRPKITPPDEDTLTSTPGQDRTGSTGAVTGETVSPPSATPSAGPHGHPDITTPHDNSATSTSAHRQTGSTVSTSQETNTPPGASPTVGPHGRPILTTPGSETASTSKVPRAGTESTVKTSSQSRTTPADRSRTTQVTGSTKTTQESASTPGIEPTPGPHGRPILTTPGTDTSSTPSTSRDGRHTTSGTMTSSPTPVPVCLEGWTHWINSDHPETGVGDIESVEGLPGYPRTCWRALTAECRVAETAEDYRSLGQLVTCGKRGLECVNDENQTCADYEVRFYCLCEPKPTAPLPSDQTPVVTPSIGPGASPAVPVTPGTQDFMTCTHGWTPLLNTDRPGDVDGGDIETMGRLRHAFSFCNEANIVAIDCVEASTGLPAAESDQRLTCDKTSGLMCMDSDQLEGECLDYAVRFYCDCHHTTESAETTYFGFTGKHTMTPTGIPTQGPGATPSLGPSGRSTIHAGTQSSQPTGIPTQGPEATPSLGPSGRSTVHPGTGTSHPSSSGTPSVGSQNRDTITPPTATPTGGEVTPPATPPGTPIGGTPDKFKHSTPTSSSSSTPRTDVTGPTPRSPATGDTPVPTPGHTPVPGEVSTPWYFTARDENPTPSPSGASPGMYPPRTPTSRPPVSPVKVPATSTVRMAHVKTTAVIDFGTTTQSTFVITEKVCNETVGVSDPDVIPKDQLTSSSSYDYTTEADRGRLDNKASGKLQGAWVARSRDVDQWIQVDMKRLELVTGVVTQGHPSGPYWVTTFTVSTSTDGVSFTPYMERGQTQPTVLARYVRILPVSWHGAIALRFDVLACTGTAILTTPSASLTTQPPGVSSVTRSHLGHGDTTTDVPSATPTSRPHVSPGSPGELTSTVVAQNVTHTVVTVSPGVTGSSTGNVTKTPFGVPTRGPDATPGSPRGTTSSSISTVSEGVTVPQTGHVTKEPSASPTSGPDVTPPVPDTHTGSTGPSSQHVETTKTPSATPTQGPDASPTTPGVSTKKPVVTPTTGPEASPQSPGDVTPTGSTTRAVGGTTDIHTGQETKKPSATPTPGPDVSPQSPGDVTPTGGVTGSTTRGVGGTTDIHTGQETKKPFATPTTGPEASPPAPGDVTSSTRTPGSSSQPPSDQSTAGPSVSPTRAPGPTPEQLTGSSLSPSATPSPGPHLTPAVPEGSESTLTPSASTPAPQCDVPMGVDNPKVIKDSQLTSSTELGPDSRAHAGRLFNEYGAWIPSVSDGNQWLQVDMGRPVPVSGVVTQGAPDTPRYVTHYLLRYSNDSLTFTTYTTAGHTPTPMTANTDNSKVARVSVNPPVTARYWRIVPTSWSRDGIALRFTLLGCVQNPVAPPKPVQGRVTLTTKPGASPTASHGTTPTGESRVTTSSSHITPRVSPTPAPALQPLCTRPMGVENYRIVSDAQLTSSSDLDKKHGAVHSRLVSSPPPDPETAWIPQPTDSEPWLQVDLREPKMLSALVIYDVKASSKFELRVSLDGKTFKPYTETRDDIPRVFYSTTGQGVPRPQYFNKNVIARYARIVPLSPAELGGVRFNLLGCNPSQENPAIPTREPEPEATPTKHIGPHGRETVTPPPDGKKTTPSSGHPMGVTDRYIIHPDQITASTSMDNAHTPDMGRLYNQPVPPYSDAWAPKYGDTPWIQVDLLKPKLISGIVTQGSRDLDRWVTSYHVTYSLDGVTFTPYTDQPGDVTPKLFTGNADNTTPVRKLFNRDVIARYVRVEPVEGTSDGLALRLDVLGCSPDPPRIPLLTPSAISGTGVPRQSDLETPSPPSEAWPQLTPDGQKGCSVPMGVSNRQMIQDRQLHASTCLDSQHCADRGRLYMQKDGQMGGAWQPSVSDGRQWIEVDFLGQYPVSGVSTQGSAESPSWVTSYLVYTSTDGTHFYPIPDPEDNSTARVFDGNTDQFTPVHNMFHKVIARYVRIRPVEYNGAIAMRFNVYGCEPPTPMPYAPPLVTTVTGTVSTVTPPAGGSTGSVTDGSKPTSTFQLLTGSISPFAGSSKDKSTTASSGSPSATPTAEPGVSPVTRGHVSVSTQSATTPGGEESTPGSPAEPSATPTAIPRVSPSWFASLTTTKKDQTATVVSGPTLKPTAQPRVSPSLTTSATGRDKTTTPSIGPSFKPTAEPGASPSLTSSTQSQSTPGASGPSIKPTAEPTVTPPHLTSTSSSCVYWSPWFSRDQPSELGQVVSFWDMTSMMSVCPEQHVKDMQCRAKNTKLPLDQTGQAAECDKESLTLICENTPDQTCLQYEIRVLCDECDVTTTPSNDVTPAKKLHCKNKWSTWINRDSDPSDGDRERLSNWEAAMFCPGGRLSKAECHTVDGDQPFYLTSLATDCDVTSGFTCDVDRNAPLPCQDFKMRYYCECPAVDVTETTRSPGTQTTAVPGSGTQVPGKISSPTTTPSSSRTDSTDSATTNKSDTSTTRIPLFTYRDSDVRSSSPAPSPTPGHVPDGASTGSPTPWVTCQSGWSVWVNRDKPSVGEGEKEFMTHSELTEFCLGGTLDDVDCETVSDVPHYLSGQKVTCDVADGLTCKNSDNFPNGCSDFKIRYHCQCPEPTKLSTLGPHTTLVPDLLTSSPGQVFYTTPAFQHNVTAWHATQSSDITTKTGDIPDITPSAHPPGEPTVSVSIDVTSQGTLSTFGVTPTGSPTIRPEGTPTVSVGSTRSSSGTTIKTGEPTAHPHGEPTTPTSSDTTVKADKTPSGTPTAHPRGEPTTPTSSDTTVKADKTPSGTPTAHPHGEPTTLTSSGTTVKADKTPSGTPTVHPHGQPTTVSVHSSSGTTDKKDSSPTGTPSAHPHEGPTVSVGSTQSPSGTTDGSEFSTTDTPVPGDVDRQTITPPGRPQSGATTKGTLSTSFTHPSGTVTPSGTTTGTEFSSTGSPVPGAVDRQTITPPRQGSDATTSVHPRGSLTTSFGTTQSMSDTTTKKGETPGATPSRHPEASPTLPVGTTQKRSDTTTKEGETPGATPSRHPDVSPTLPVGTTLASHNVTRTGLETSSLSPSATPSAVPSFTPSAPPSGFQSTSIRAEGTPTRHPDLTPVVTRCSKSTWTPWVNRDLPETGGGDYEKLTKDELSAQCIGGVITNIECYSGDTPAVAMGEVVACSVDEGLVCNNDDNTPVPCSDYKVRYFCDCHPETTETPTSTPVPKVYPQCAWSPWLNADQPHAGPDDKGDVETIDLLKTTYGLCRDIVDVQCRVAGTATPADDHVTCDAQNGLRCYNKEQPSGACYDYEIRVLCWAAQCEGPTPTPPDEPQSSHITTRVPEIRTTVACKAGYEWSACAFTCDDLCDYMARSSGACDGSAVDGCVPGCQPVSSNQAKCPAGQRRLDADTCVPNAMCTCLKPDGTPAKDTPNTGAGDLETIGRAASQFGTCSKPLAVECREVGTKVKAENSGQTLTCDAATGLTCHNADNVERCKDYEIRVYCLCASTTEGTTQSTTPTARPHIPINNDENPTPTPSSHTSEPSSHTSEPSSHTAEPSATPTARPHIPINNDENPTSTPSSRTKEPSSHTTEPASHTSEPSPLSTCGWTSWMSSHTPGAHGEQETLPGLRRQFQFCPTEDITAVECRDSVRGMSAGQQAGVICDLRHSGLICRQQNLAPGEQCLDYEVRFLCEPKDKDCTSEVSLTPSYPTFATNATAQGVTTASYGYSSTVPGHHGSVSPGSRIPTAQPGASPTSGTGSTTTSTLGSTSTTPQGHQSTSGDSTFTPPPGEPTRHPHLTPEQGASTEGTTPLGHRSTSGDSTVTPPSGEPTRHPHLTPEQGASTEATTPLGHRSTSGDSTVTPPSGEPTRHPHLTPEQGASTEGTTPLGHRSTSGDSTVTPPSGEPTRHPHLTPEQGASTEGTTPLGHRSTSGDSTVTPPSGEPTRHPHLTPKQGASTDATTPEEHRSTSGDSTLTPPPGEPTRYPHLTPKQGTPTSSTPEGQHSTSADSTFTPSPGEPTRHPHLTPEQGASTEATTPVGHRSTSSDSTLTPPPGEPTRHPHLTPKQGTPTGQTTVSVHGSSSPSLATSTSHASPQTRGPTAKPKVTPSDQGTTPASVMESTVGTPEGPTPSKGPHVTPTGPSVETTSTSRPSTPRPVPGAQTVVTVTPPTTTTPTTTTSAVVTPYQPPWTTVPVCADPMKDGTPLPMTKSLLEASSTLSRYTGPERVVFNSQQEGPYTGAWIPAATDSSPWVQVHFPDPTVITSVSTMGRQGTRSWVTSYHVMFSMDGKRYYYYEDTPGVPKEFTGNNDSSTEVRHVLKPVTAQHVMIQPVTWHDTPAMRFSLTGCIAPKAVVTIAPTPSNTSEAVPPLPSRVTPTPAPSLPPFYGPGRSFVTPTPLPTPPIP
ncbi:hypothetical protein BaRGS_00024788, partial [Batillaria attramentaria]